MIKLAGFNLEAVEELLGCYSWQVLTCFLWDSTACIHACSGDDFNYANHIT